MLSALDFKGSVGVLRKNYHYAGSNPEIRISQIPTEHLFDKKSGIQIESNYAAKAF